MNNKIEKDKFCPLYIMLERTIFRTVTLSKLCCLYIASNDYPMNFFIRTKRTHATNAVIKLEERAKGRFRKKAIRDP